MAGTGGPLPFAGDAWKAGVLPKPAVRAVSTRRLDHVGPCREPFDSADYDYRTIWFWPFVSLPSRGAFHLQGPFRDAHFSELALLPFLRSTAVGRAYRPTPMYLLVPDEFWSATKLSVTT
jgi:hypothetical protein